MLNDLANLFKTIWICPINNGKPLKVISHRNDIIRSVTQKTLKAEGSKEAGK
jgi:hypothetical protein